MTTWQAAEIELLGKSRYRDCYIIIINDDDYGGEFVYIRE